MKIRHKRTLSLPGMLLVLFVSHGWLAPRTLAQRAEEPPASRQSDVMTAGRDVRIQAEVEGDVAAAGADVRVTAPVSGYVMSAGRHVTLDSTIGNDLWAAGETVDVTSHVGNNVMAAGRTVHLHPETVVGQDARLAGNLVTAEGRIDRNLRIGAATARIAADIGGTVHVAANRVFVQPGTVIAGDLVVRASEPPEVSPDARIGGTVRFEEAEADGGWPGQAWFWVLCFVALLILGLAALALSPQWAGRVAGTIQTRPAASMLTGILVLILTPIVAAALAITVVGVPLAVILLASYAIALLLALVVTSYRTGNWLLARLHRSASPWVGMGLGVLILSMGLFLPFVGWLVALIALFVGTGALALEGWDLRARLRGQLA